MMTYVFKPTDMLVKAQVTMFMLGLHKSIEDVPPMYNLREAVAQAMGMTVEQMMPAKPEPEEAPEEEL